MNQRKRNGVLWPKFIGNTGWMMFRQIYSMLISLVVGSLSARYLGPSNYGLLNYGSSIIAFFTTISKMGMDSVVVAEMARAPEKEDSYLGSALMIRLISSLLSFFAVAGIVVVLEPNNRMLQVVTILQAVAIVFQSAEVLYFWFQVKLEMKYVTLASMIALTAAAVWRIALLANAASVQWFAMSSSVSALVCGVSIVIFFVRRARMRPRVNLSDAGYILSQSVHFVINGLAVTLYTQIDRIMLGKMVSDEAVGFYAAASTIAVMWEFVPNALVQSARPILVQKYDADKASFEKMYQMLLLGICLLGLAVGVFFTALAKPVVFILYGAEYYASVPALAILIWSTSFAMIGTARGIWIVAERKNRYAKYFTLIGAAVNVALNAVFIPRWGILGASVTTLISQVVVAMAAPLLYRETRDFSRLLWGSFRCFPELARLGVEKIKHMVCRNNS